MDELIQKFQAAGIRYLLVGGQAMRLEGMPRFSMDWDLFIPPRDTANIAASMPSWKTTWMLPCSPWGSAERTSYRPTRHGGESFNSTWVFPACLPLPKRNAVRSFTSQNVRAGQAVLRHSG